MATSSGEAQRAMPAGTVEAKRKFHGEAMLAKSGASGSRSSPLSRRASPRQSGGGSTVTLCIWA